MAQLIAWNVMTLDGYFEGLNSWELDWHDSIWGEELEALSLEQLNSADGLLFGRKTYEGMAAYWANATGAIAELMNAVPKIVFSRNLHGVTWQNSRLIKENALAEVVRLKEVHQRNLYIFGSADFSAPLLQAGLIDEYRLAIVPLLLGQGNPLFKTSPERLKLRLIEARPLQTGGVLLRYQKGV